jgi:hypothetical protein
MANPTTNFGWVMPTATDLVTDLPADFDVFGQAVDTSLADLKGGTTGQVLSKATNADMDFTWVAQDDSNAIQNSIVDAKGDIIGATADNTPARLGVGTNGQVLTADSTAATGLKWAAAASTPTFVGVRLVNSTTIAVNNNTTTTVTFDTETFDTDAFHSTATNTSRITIPAGKAGKYSIIQSGFFIGSNSTGYGALFLFKNGTQFCENYLYFDGASKSDLQLYTTVLDLAEGDYIETRVSQTSGGTLSWYPQVTYGQFTATYLGA